MTRRGEAALWGLVAIGLWLAFAQLSSRRSRPADAIGVSFSAPGTPETQDPDSLFAAAESAVEHNVFRLNRRSAGLPFQVDPVDSPSPQPEPPPRPPLVLAGIIGQGEWQALIEGLPGRSGAVLVHSGETIGELRIRSIERDSVVIAGPDTTWRLGLKRTWQ